MFKKKQTEKSALDKAIDEALRELIAAPSDSKHYKKIREQLTELYAMRKIDADIKNATAWRPEFVVPAIASVAGILIIVGYERMNVVTSKALNFVMKSN